MDNSTNTHVLKDKSLFINNINPYLLGANVGTIIDMTKPAGISLAEIQQYDNDSYLYKATMHDALYFLDLPINIISISKLALDY